MKKKMNTLTAAEPRGQELEAEGETIRRPFIDTAHRAVDGDRQQDLGQEKQQQREAKVQELEDEGDKALNGIKARIKEVEAQRDSLAAWAAKVQEQLLSVQETAEQYLKYNLLSSSDPLIIRIKQAVSLLSYLLPTGVKEEHGDG